MARWVARRVVRWVVRREVRWAVPYLVQVVYVLEVVTVQLGGVPVPGTGWGGTERGTVGGTVRGTRVVGAARRRPRAR